MPRTTSNTIPSSRAVRRRVRAAVVPPQRDEAFSHLTLGDLRLMRSGLMDEEARVSYWRRVIQARIDVLQAGGRAGERVADLTRVLADAPGIGRRLAHLSVRPVDDVPPLPDLAALWSRQVGDDDPAGLAALVAELSCAEGKLSQIRSALFGRIDAATAELIARYREDPTLALAALPVDLLSVRL